MSSELTVGVVLLESRSSTRFMTSADYKDIYLQDDRTKNFADILVKGTNRAYFFDLSAGSDEQTRSFGAMVDNIAGYVTALADACYERRHELRTIVAIGGKFYKYGRTRVDDNNVITEVTPDPKLPKLNLVFESGRHIYNSGVEVGYTMYARLVPTEEFERVLKSYNESFNR